MEVKTF